MGLFLNRKMTKLESIMNATIELCTSKCEKDDDLKLEDCPKCFAFCPQKCPSFYYNYGSLSPPTTTSSPPHHKTTPSTFLTVAIVLLAASFILVCAYALYAKRYMRRRRNNIPSSTTTTNPNPNDDSEPQQQQQRDFLDHGGAAVEHHIWYIRTVGLDPAAISSITALKYRKDEGLVEGTDCSVCLSEFQEDEALRLLPKCSHAFHVACIDTWLRSHTNCPMCRAPVLAGPVKLSSSSSGDQSSGSHEEEETRIEILSSDVEESEVAENPNESLGVEPSRRSVSLDCLGAKELEVIKELRNVNSGKRVEKKLERLRSGGSSNRQNVSSSSSSSSASAMKRSKSCHGKFVLCRPIRVTDSILPLRSV